MEFEFLSPTLGHDKSNFDAVKKQNWSLNEKIWIIGSRFSLVFPEIHHYLSRFMSDFNAVKSKWFLSD